MQAQSSLPRTRVPRGLMVLRGSLAGQIRYEIFKGRRHLVAPVVLLVEGVHTGMGGRALYYPASELAKFPQSWNNRPVVVYHPTERDEDGEIIPVSANSPEVLQREEIGLLFNTWYDDAGRKLRSEIWVDEEITRRTVPNLLTKLMKGEKIEDSTGLFHDLEEIGGVWNGETYEAISINHRPDHLALLPGGEGACNLNDGCGVFNQKGNDMGNEKHEAGKIRGFLQALARMLGWKEEEIAGILTDNAEMSHDAMRERIQKMMDAMDTEEQRHYVRDVFEDHFVFEARPMAPGMPRKLMKQRFKMGEDERIMMDGEAEEVIKRRSYMPSDMPMKEKDMPMGMSNKEDHIVDKPSTVNALIANQGNRFAEADRPWLLTLSEDQLGKMTPEDKKSDAPTINCEVCTKKATVKANTVGEYVSQAPREIQGVLNRALRHEQEKKDALIEGILANDRNRFSKEALGAKDVDELEVLAALAGASYQEDAAGFNYAGQGGYQINLGREDNVPVLD